MDLNAEHFAALCRHLELDPRNCETDREKRRARRLSHRGHVCISIPPAAPIRVEVANISSRGIALLMRHPLEKCRQFLLQMPDKLDATGEVRILCAVASCRPDSRGRYRIGAEFLCAVPASPAVDPTELERQRARIRESMFT